VRALSKVGHMPMPTIEACHSLAKEVKKTLSNWYETALVLLLFKQRKGLRSLHHRHGHTRVESKKNEVHEATQDVERVATLQYTY
jgi:hypothetical protein